MKNYTYIELLKELNTGSPKDYWIMFEGFLFDLCGDWDAVDEVIELCMEMPQDDFDECLMDIYDEYHDKRALAFRDSVWSYIERKTV